MSTLFGEPDVQALLREKIIELEKEILDLRKGNEDREKNLKESLKYVATSYQRTLDLVRNGWFEVDDIQTAEEAVIDGTLEEHGIDLTSIRSCRESWKRRAEQRAQADKKADVAD